MASTNQPTVIPVLKNAALQAVEKVIKTAGKAASDKKDEYLQNVLQGMDQLHSKFTEEDSDELKEIKKLSNTIEANQASTNEELRRIKNKLQENRQKDARWQSRMDKKL